jgi:protocatechuate 3,4-dioxygenase alpha subunit
VRRTPSQTVGPFYAIGCGRRSDANLVAPDTNGALRLTGTLYDGAGDPIGDGMVELWDGVGHSWGRSGTQPAGEFRFTVAKPAAATPNAPHIEVVVFARGLLKHQLTRIYFPDEPANETDPLLTALSEVERATLVAAREDGGLRFDIRMQGDRQTVFFAT